MRSRGELIKSFIRNPRETEGARRTRGKQKDNQ